MAEKIQEGILKIKAEYVRTTFPKPSEGKKITDNENSFGICVWEVTEEDEENYKKVETNYKKEIIIKGEYPCDPKPFVTYDFLIKEVIHPTYGTQYQLLYMREIIDFSHMSGQRAYLKTILSPTQLDGLFEMYDNPIEIIAKHDREAIKKVKGIGDVLVERIIRDFEATKDMSGVYAELDKLGLTTNFINKIISHYRDPQKVINICLKDPYRLIRDVEGIGFITADKVALQGGLPFNSIERIKAFILYYLEERVQKGHSYISARELNDNIFAALGDKEELLEFYDENDKTKNNVNYAIQQLIEKNKIRIEKIGEDKASRRIYLVYYYDLEKEIAKQLKRILKGKDNFKVEDVEEKIKLAEEKQGFEFTEEQKEGIKLGLNSQVCLITGAAGCVDSETEFFNGKGWKKISDYKNGDKVLQWDYDTCKATLVNPIRYIKEPCEKMYHFETKYGLNQTLTEDHRIPFFSAKNYFRETNILEIIEKQKNNGWHGKILTSFNYSGSKKGINLTDDEIRLSVAVIADGSFTVNNTSLCRFHIKKERKKERLKQLIANTGRKIDERPSVAEGYNDYYIYAPILDKEFESWWYKCNQHQLRIICDEVMYWDGSINKTKNGVTRKKFSTTSKKSADFIQFAFSATGYRANITIRDRKGQEYVTNNKTYIRKSAEYYVTVTKRNKVGICCDNRPNHTKTKIEEVVPTDGFKYCFTVPSSYLVLRRNNCIFITGNCGKSSLVTGILSILSGYSFAQTAFSGKAAARLQEVTGEKGQTIHRLLCYDPKTCTFIHNEKNPLPYDIIILDEVSLVGGDIFLQLLKAIPTGSKFYMLGDVGQLEAIGPFNLASDILDSDIIPTVELTKVHRQAQKSGILTTAYNVRNQIQLIDDYSFSGAEICGELKDMILEITQNKDDNKELVLTYFKKYYNSDLVNKDIMKIQVISPIKERGNTCVHALNNLIQDYVNPKTDDKNFKLVKKRKNDNDNDFSYELRENDKVMCIKNNYKASISLTDEINTSIFNGWTGIITQITESYIAINFPLAEYETVYLPTKEIGNYIMLGYCCSCHKMQGSDSPVIIGVIDYSTPPQMLTKQLVYTLITRAKKICVLIAQNTALRKAINTNFVSKKKTFLPEFLKEN